MVGGGIAVMVAGLEQEKEGTQPFVSQGDDRALVSTTDDQCLKLGVERRFSAAGGVSKLTEESADVGIALADPSGLAVSGASLICVW